MDRVYRSIFKVGQGVGKGGMDYDDLYRFKQHWRIYHLHLKKVSNMHLQVTTRTRMQLNKRIVI